MSTEPKRDEIDAPSTEGRTTRDPRNLRDLALTPEQEAKVRAGLLNRGQNDEGWTSN
jgi:hypothetical protein